MYWGPRNPRGGMSVNFLLPQQLPGTGVDCIHHATVVTKESSVTPSCLALDETDTDCRSHQGLRFKPPINATCGCAERIYFPSLASNEYTPADYRRLCTGTRVTGKAESPFEFQMRNL